MMPGMRISGPKPKVVLMGTVTDKEPWLWGAVSELMESENTLENFAYIKQAVKEKRDRDKAQGE